MDVELIYLIGLDWAEFALRWLHVVTAIAWIGSSFYFIALDLGLRRDGRLPGGVHGDCLLYTSPSPRDRPLSRMPSSA